MHAGPAATPTGSGDDARPGPTVSVVLPVFNGERFLATAVSSVLTQTFEDLELVVVDDGSTDSTPAILQHFAADRRVVRHRQQRSGIVVALNEGLQLATAPWIARMDADDIMKPDRLSSQLAFLEEHPELCGVASDYELMDEDDRPRGAVRSPLRSAHAVDAYMRRGLPVVFSHPTVMISREAIEAVGGYRAEYRDSEDVDLFTRVLDSGRKIVVQPEELLLLRVHRRSISAGASRRQLMLNDLIVRNSARRRAGLPEIGVDEYAAGHCASLPARVDFERRLLRARLIRRATLHRRDGRRLARAAVMALALAVDPGRAVAGLAHRLRAWLARTSR